MLRMTKTALLALALCAATSVTALAQDQESGAIDVDLPARKKAEEPAPARSYAKPGPLRVYGGFNVAVGGNAKLTSDNAFLGTPSASLDPTIGLQGGMDYVLHDYFAIGGETRFLWWKTDGAGDRNFFWDLDVKPRGRYAFSNLPLEVYGALPIGLTVPALKGEAEGKVGFNVGLLGGAYWFFTENLGINAEMGWVFHRIGQDYVGTSAHIKTNQFLLLCPNFVYAL